MGDNSWKQHHLEEQSAGWRQNELLFGPNRVYQWHFGFESSSCCPPLKSFMASFCVFCDFETFTGGCFFGAFHFCSGLWQTPTWRRTLAPWETSWRFLPAVMIPQPACCSQFCFLFLLSKQQLGWRFNFFSILYGNFLLRSHLVYWVQKRNAEEDTGFERSWNPEDSWMGWENWLW